MIGAILGGLSAVASGIQAFQGMQQTKNAQKGLEKGISDYLSGGLSNAYKGLQVPDISKMGYEQTQRALADSTQAVASMGPEWAAQIANINQGALQQQAEDTAKQAAMNYERDQAVIAQEQKIKDYEAEKRDTVAGMRIEGAAEAAKAGREATSSALTGLAQGLMGMGGAIGGSENYWQWLQQRKNK
jgi:hypothetical protein